MKNFTLRGLESERVRDYRMLVGFEYKKLLKKKIVWIMMVIMMALCVFGACSNLFGAFYVEGELFETHYEKLNKEQTYARNLSGRPIDDELLSEMWDNYAKVEETETSKWLTESYQKYARPYNSILYLLMEIAGVDDVENMSAAQIYELRKNQQKQEWEGYYLTEGEKAYLTELDKEVRQPFVYAYGDGYECISSMLHMVGILMTLLLAVCIPGVFTEEHIRKTDQLILCSQYGKKRLFSAKVFTAVSFTIAAAILLILSLIIPVFIVYGTDGFSSQIQLSLPTTVWTLSRGQMMLILIGLCLVVSLFQCFVSLFLAEMTKSNVAVMAVMIGVMLLCMLLNIPAQYRVISQIYSFFPVNALYIVVVFGPRLIHAFGTYWTTWQVIPVIYLVIAVVLFFFGKRQYEHYQVDER